MSIGSLIETTERHLLSMYHYAPEPSDLADQFATRNVTVEYRPLPADGPPPFVVIRRDDRFVGAVGVETLRTYLRPPVVHPADLDDLSPAYRAVFELLDDTVFTSLSRRQLLATSREIEDRAWRVGTGELHAGFQSARTFHAQAELYRQLATETDLDVHVYVVDDPATLDTPVDVADVTVHTEPTNEVGRHWFLVFDGGGSPDQLCALVAEQRDHETYSGVWTYDPQLVTSALDALPPSPMARRE